MRERDPYSVEKQTALDRIEDMIEYTADVPLYPWEEKAYRKEIKRLAVRYGLIRDLKRRGYDVNGECVTKLENRF